jgi:hypothetical protein
MCLATCTMVWVKLVEIQHLRKGDGFGRSYESSRYWQKSESLHGINNGLPTRANKCFQHLSTQANCESYDYDMEDRSCM